MSDHAQYAAFGAAIDREIARKANHQPEPLRFPGLEALGRSSHGGAPVHGSIHHAVAHTPHTSLDTDDVAA
jgi:hypothetical protein